MGRRRRSASAGRTAGGTIGRLSGTADARAGIAAAIPARSPADRPQRTAGAATWQRWAVGQARRVARIERRLSARNAGRTSPAKLVGTPHMVTIAQVLLCKDGKPLKFLSEPRCGAEV